MSEVYMALHHPVDKIRTTIGVRLATKHLVLNRSLPGESLEDAILRMIHERDGFENEISHLKLQLEKNGIKEPNRITLSESTRRTGEIDLIDGTLIVFSYMAPDQVMVNTPDYMMDIAIEKVITNGRSYTFDNLSLSEKDRILIHFKMLEKVINVHFDRGFELSDKAFLIDPQYWKRVFSRAGIPESSYLADVLKIISEYESGHVG